MSSAAFAARPRHIDNPFCADLFEGLRRRHKRIPSKYFYDVEGSLLFERITGLAEYYPTRTEIGILKANAAQIANLIGPDVELVEFGAGSLRKVRILLDAMQTPQSYVPIDIAGDYLMEVAEVLEGEYPRLHLNPVVADFTLPVELEVSDGRRAGFLPGSTIGNFGPAEAAGLLRHMRQTLGGGGLLIGVDLVKSPALLHAAYNDSKGVTAAFNKNLLARANRELGADFDLGAFAHYACYNPMAQKIEMYLVSMARQHVCIAGDVIAFEQGEAIHTEDSHKYTLSGFRALALEAGYVPRAIWTDEARLFSVQWLEAV
ncbi:MAG: L-histidine N(alpha)-methyltransferase [Rhizomicrobium sp.]